MNKRSNRKLHKKLWLLNRSDKIIRNNKKNNNITLKHQSFFLDSETLEDGEFNVVEFLKKKKFIEKSQRSKKIEIEMLQNFSLTTNAEEVINLFKRLIYYITNSRTRKLYFNHDTIENISLSASLIQDLILMDAVNYIEKFDNKPNLEFKGSIRKDTDIGILIHANGVLPHLGFKVEKDKNVETLNIIFGTPNNSSVTSPDSDILKYFTNCLKRHDFELTKEGKGKFGKLLGEVLDNCKIHSGSNSKWYALGFYHHKGKIGKCHIAIVTFGNTIYESLCNKKGNVVTNETYSLLVNKTNIHRPFFVKDKWDEETLWTLLSLQDGVSRLRDSNEVSQMNRGKGTVDMLQSFQSIGKSSNCDKAQFSLISGSVLIDFDFDKYQLKEEIFENEPRRIIAFNKNNNIDMPPDFENVKKLKSKFPGTIISMEFYIDSEYISNNEQEYLRSIEQ